MSPIDENELRDELWFADAPAPAPDPAALTEAVIARGRAIRTLRILVAVIAALLAATLLLIGFWTTLRPSNQDAVPLETPTVVPEPWQSPATPSAGPTPSASAAPTRTPTRRPSASARPTPSASASATPRPTASGRPSASATGTPRPGGSATASTTPARYGSRTEMPATFGDLGGFRLPHQGSAGYEAIPMGVLSCDAYDGRVTLPALAELEAGRHLNQTEGEAGQAEAVLVFRTEDAAAQFMSQLRTAARRCADAPLPTTRPAGDPRTPFQVRTTGIGTDGLAVGSSSQLYEAGQWKDVPGGSLELWTRRGRAVVMSNVYGEYVGDVYADRSDVVTELRGELEKSLPQMCRWTTGGC